MPTRKKNYHQIFFIVVTNSYTKVDEKRTISLILTTSKKSNQLKRKPDFTRFCFLIRFLISNKKVSINISLLPSFIIRVLVTPLLPSPVLWCLIIAELIPQSFQLKRFNEHLPLNGPLIFIKNTATRNNSQCCLKSARRFKGYKDSQTAQLCKLHSFRRPRLGSASVPWSGLKIGKDSWNLQMWE